MESNNETTWLTGKNQAGLVLLAEEISEPESEGAKVGRRKEGASVGVTEGTNVGVTLLVGADDGAKEGAAVGASVQTGAVKLTTAGVAGTKASPELTAML